MRNLFLVLILSLVCGQNAIAQDGLFMEERRPARQGFIIGINGGLDFPAADMADRFGTSYRIGPSLHYKTKSNWMIGIKFDFILGNRIEEDSLMYNVRDKNGAFIGFDGERKVAQIFQRGYITGIQVGKLLPISKTNAESGLLVQTSMGFMQHKINIFERDDQIPQIRGEYKKGYDRLTNGIYIEPSIGYVHFSKNKLINFHIGLNATVGFLQGRRDWLYDVNRAGTDSRLDILFGIRGGWYLPIFKQNKREEIFFE